MTPDMRRGAYRDPTTGRWTVYSAASLLALLSMAGALDVIDCEPGVAAELLEMLVQRSVEVRAAGNGVLAFPGRTPTVTERRAVRLLRDDLHRVLVERHADEPNQAAADDVAAAHERMHR